MTVAHLRRLVQGSIAAACGVMVWWITLQVLPSVPIALRVLAGFLVFVVGPGAAAFQLVADKADRLERLVAPLAAGVLVSAALAHVLGAFNALTWFPWIAAALTGVAAWCVVTRRSGLPLTRREWLACFAVAALAAVLGTIAYAKRLDADAHGFTLYGSYDSYDSSYYAAMSSALAYHIPTEAPFQAGHRLNYSYHPEIVLAMVYRFASVPLIDLYFRYAWPVFLTMLALTTFMFVRRVADWRAAVVAGCLLLLGSDLSYLAALFFQTTDWDDLIWANNWMTPSAEMLYFNPWTIALSVLFLGLWLLQRAQQEDAWPVLVAPCVCFGSLVQFKPFAFASVAGALAAAIALGRLDPPVRRRYAVVLLGSVAVAVPYLVLVFGHYLDSQSVLTLGNGYTTVLPRVVARQFEMTPPGQNRAAAMRIIAIANLLFFAGGVGARWAGVGLLWRALTGRDRPVRCVMAWMVLAGAAAPLVVISQPYHQTFQFFHLSLYLLWLFVAWSLYEYGDNRRFPRAVTIALVIAAAIPTTVHYLQVKWQDDDHPFARVGPETLAVVEYLTREDPARTVLLQHYPDRPSFISMLSERRTLLAWSRYARASASLQAEIDAFYRSARTGTPEASAILARYGVTHVLETIGIDQIHPDVLRSLRPVVTNSAYRLYAVPVDAEETR